MRDSKGSVIENDNDPLPKTITGNAMFLPEEEWEGLYGEYWCRSVEFNFLLERIAEIRAELIRWEHALLRKVEEDGKGLRGGRSL